MNKIKLRKFPYPFSAALAICSDIDACFPMERFLNLQKYLCSSKETFIGRGLGLEIGNSFWFFRNSEHKGISYFEERTSQKTDFAPYILELVKSGYLDSLHTYGDFNQGGFERKYAELAVDEIVKQNMNIKIWINHGNKNNSQNIGNLSYFKGDEPNNLSYHFDLTKSLGIKYYWISQITHLVGQSASSTIKNSFRNQVQRLYALKNMGKQINPFFSNLVMDEYQLRDGNKILAFQRFINPWGKYSFTDINNLKHQISRNVLNELIANEGYLILYTHLGHNNSSEQIIPKDAQLVFEELTSRYRGGEIFLTTTSRLLQYYEVTQNIKYEIKENGNLKEIHISLSNNEIDEKALQGITFYTDVPERTVLIFNKKNMHVQINGADKNKMRSISIPWKKLEYPF